MFQLSPLYLPAYRQAGLNLRGKYPVPAGRQGEGLQERVREHLKLILNENLGIKGGFKKW
jgi:hypothetical protein